MRLLKETKRLLSGALKRTSKRVSNIDRSYESAADVSGDRSIDRSYESYYLFFNKSIWIAPRQKTIDNGAKMAKKESSCNTANITTFFTPTNPDSVARMRRWRQDKLICDAYTRRRGDKSAQQSITGYLTLSGQLD